MFPPVCLEQNRFLISPLSRLSSYSLPCLFKNANTDWWCQAIYIWWQKWDDKQTRVQTWLFWQRSPFTGWVWIRSKITCDSGPDLKKSNSGLSHFWVKRSDLKCNVKVSLAPLGCYLSFSTCLVQTGDLLLSWKLVFSLQHLLNCTETTERLKENQRAARAQQTVTFWTHMKLLQQAFNIHTTYNRTYNIQYNI